MKENEVDFPALKSVPDKLLTVLVFGFFLVLTALLLICILAIPLAFQFEHGNTPGWGAVIFDIFYYTLILWLLYWIFNRYQKTKSRRLNEIVVDRDGIHYYSINGTKNAILYTELEKSTKMYEKDIDWKPKIRTSIGYIHGHKGGNHLKISFNSHDFGAVHLLKNKHQLVAHFLKGVKRFDSNLSISDSVFSEFHIDKHTFEYDKKGHLKFVAICMMICIFIILAIVYFTRITE